MTIAMVILLVAQLFLIYRLWSTLRRLTYITESSLRVRGGSFEAFSPHELMTQSEKVEECRRRHAGSTARSGDDDSAFELEAAEDLLDKMHAGNHDGDRRSQTPYWTRARVHERAAEFHPNGRKWKEHQARRDSHIREIQAANGKAS